MERIAVLSSGGLDSCVLIADLAKAHEIFPVHVAMGMIWEEPERKALRRFLGAIAQPNIHPLTELVLPVESVYGTHWSLTGQGVPPSGTPDEEVYLPGRNILLLGIAGVWGSLHRISAIAMGSLACNPFPDGTPDFFEKYGRVLGTGLNHPLRVWAPYRTIDKATLIRRFCDLPLELTLTCMTPITGDHCGQCSKCGERQQAFRDAEVPDQTRYAAPQPPPD